MAVYNQQDNRLDVYIHADSVGASDRPNEKSTNPNDKEENTLDNSRHKISKRQISKAINVSRTMVNIATRQVPNFVIGQFSNMTGDSNYQAICQRNMERFQDVSSAVMGIGASAVLFGPAGAMMAGIGTALSLTSKYESRNIETGLSIWKQEQSINYNKARSGIDITDGRTRLR